MTFDKVAQVFTYKESQIFKLVERQMLKRSITKNVEE